LHNLEIKSATNSRKRKQKDTKNSKKVTKYLHYPIDCIIFAGENWTKHVVCPKVSIKRPLLLYRRFYRVQRIYVRCL